MRAAVKLFLLFSFLSQGGWLGQARRSSKAEQRGPLAISSLPPPMRDAQGNPNTGQMLVFVPPHPLIKHWLAIARNVVLPRSLPLCKHL